LIILYKITEKKKKKEKTAKLCERT